MSPPSAAQTSLQSQTLRPAANETRATTQDNENHPLLENFEATLQEMTSNKAALRRPDVAKAQIDALTYRFILEPRLKLEAPGAINAAVAMGEKFKEELDRGRTQEQPSKEWLSSEAQRLISRSAENSPSRIAKLNAMEAGYEKALHQFGTISPISGEATVATAKEADNLQHGMQDNDKQVALAMLLHFRDQLDQMVDYAQAVGRRETPTAESKYFRPTYPDTDASDVEAARNMFRNITQI